MSAISDGDLLDLDLVAAAEAIRTHQVSSIEVTSAWIRQIGPLQPMLNCFISGEPYEDLAAAGRADDEIAGESFGGLCRVSRLLKGHALQGRQGVDLRL